MQYGQEEDFEFYAFELPPPKPSSWNVYPTRENPDGLFKYGSIEVNMSQDLSIWNRQTYSLLDYIGDLGGLLDGLKSLCAIIIAPFSTFSLQSLLLTTIFRYRPHNDEKEQQTIKKSAQALQNNKFVHNSHLLKNI